MVNPVPGWQPTCGEAGYPCTPDCEWQIERHQIGANQGGLPPLFCNYWVTFETVAINSCTGERHRVSCDHYHDGSGVGMDCCDAWGCWGADDC